MPLLDVKQCPPITQLTLRLSNFQMVVAASLSSTRHGQTLRSVRLVDVASHVLTTAARLSNHSGTTRLPHNEQGSDVSKWSGYTVMSS